MQSWTFYTAFFFDRNLESTFSHIHASLQLQHNQTLTGDSLYHQLQSDYQDSNRIRRTT